MSTAMTKREIEEKIIARAWQDASFKQELLSNPRTAFEKEGIPLPQSIELRVVEESSNTLYFVLPMQPSETGELSEAELESVAGGGWVGADDNGSDNEVSTNSPNGCCPRA
ncbi:NHLP leader peptide family natural product precursor [Cyanobacteria bacterium FACHB-472]|nr:NHLP leader peptide family natural product precursor [Cyanobacteria bacterium FACHB-472]